jgi:hypothetical protein
MPSRSRIGCLISDCAKTTTEASSPPAKLNRVWGIAYNIKPTGTVIRASYARTLETPFNENLALSSLGCNDAEVNNIVSTIQGYPCVTNKPLSPGFRNEFHAGLGQAFGRFAVVDAEYIWKYTHAPYSHYRPVWVAASRELYRPTNGMVRHWTPPARFRTRSSVTRSTGTWCSRRSKAASIK